VSYAGCDAATLTSKIFVTRGPASEMSMPWTSFICSTKYFVDDRHRALRSLLVPHGLPRQARLSHDGLQLVAPLSLQLVHHLPVERLLAGHDWDCENSRAVGGGETFRTVARLVRASTPREVPVTQQAPPVAAPYEVARAFADAYAAGDAAAIAPLLDPDAHEREVTPGTIVDQRGPEAIAGEMSAFLAPYDEPETLVHELEPLGDRFRWTTRWRLTGGDGPWLVEWHAFLTVADGVVTGLDIVCSGRVRPDVAA
jgi:hypothetical protein